LLRQSEILERIAALRAQRNLAYELGRDTMGDKLEGVFFDALEDRNFAPAVAAVRLQAVLQGLLPRPRAAPRVRATPEAAKNDEKSRRGPRKMMRKARER
jgi:hypothetical protein